MNTSFPLTADEARKLSESANVNRILSHIATLARGGWGYLNLDGEHLGALPYTESDLVRMRELGYQIKDEVRKMAGRFGKPRRMVSVIWNGES